jgi:hypothetical protein
LLIAGFGYDTVPGTVEVMIHSAFPHEIEMADTSVNKRYFDLSGRLPLLML